MDRRKNPYAPGAGTKPPALTGRGPLIEHADVLLDRLVNGYSERSLMITGLRGVGKTVLLGEFEDMAQARGWETAFRELTTTTTLPRELAKMAHRTLLALSTSERTREWARKALGILKGFGLKTADGLELSIDVDVIGGADSGDLESDLIELFLEIGEAAHRAGTGLLFLLDEVHIVRRDEFEALIAALHRTAQKNLPLAVVGAGLPSLPALAGESKTYAERLFLFPRIDRLDEQSATEALTIPAGEEGVAFEPAALEKILELTERYPYFIQEYGKWVWNVAPSSPARLEDVENAHPLVLASLDESFFRARFDRIEGMERRYLRALAELPPAERESASVAALLGRPITAVSKTRDSLIRKALIYSPSRGRLDFTVPQCDDYLKRAFPLEGKSGSVETGFGESSR